MKKNIYKPVFMNTDCMIYKYDSCVGINFMNQIRETRYISFEEINITFPYS